MTSATLFREGTDLEALLAELDYEHPGQVHVVEVNRLRDGGVFGFFARPRVAVQYTLTEPATLGDSAPTLAMSSTGGGIRGFLGPRVTPGALDDGGDPLAALISAAEVVETGRPPTPAGVEADTETATEGNVEFARMLLDIAARKAAARGVALPVRAPATGRATVERPTADRLTGSGYAPAAVPEQRRPGTRLLPPARPRTAAPSTPAASATAGAGAVRTPAAAARPAGAAAQPARPAAPTRPAQPSEVDERLTLRRRLAELGAPIARIPADAVHRYAAVEHLINQLPEPPVLPETPDAIVVVAAPATVLARLVPLLRHRLGLTAAQIWTFRAGRGTTRDDHRLIEVGDAKALAAALRRPRPVAITPTLVAVALDEDADFPLGDFPLGGESGEVAAPPGPGAAEIIAALEPDAFWLHVDATRKASDTAAAMRPLGTPDALIVTGAARTASPASVWQLDVPVALLDGRTATRSAWAVLLLEKLAETER